MATVDKNFRIKNGLAVEGTTATVNGENILRESSGDSYILNLVGGATLVKSVGTNLSVDNAGQLSIDLAGVSNDVAGNRLYADGASLNVDVEGIYDDLITNGVATTTDISNAISSASSNYDAAGSAATAQQNAENYADSLASNYAPAGSAQGAYDNAVSAAAQDATTKANTAQQNAENYADGVAGDAQDAAATYTDNAITNLNLSGTYDALGAADTALNDAKSYTDQEIAALVDSAPAMLDTLNELAAAIADNPNYASDVTNLVATKADTTYVDNQIDGVDTAAQGYATTAENNAKGYADSLASNYDVAGAASAAQQNAEDYADSLASNYDPAGSAATAESNANSYTDTAVGNIASAVSQIEGSVIAPNAVNINYVANQYATLTEGIMIADGTASVMGLSSSTYRTVKALVKATNGTHSQVSEILLTLDSSNNIAITEYAMVGTNGSLGDVTAIHHASGNIFIQFTPVYDNTDVMVYTTALI